MAPTSLSESNNNDNNEELNGPRSEQLTDANGNVVWSAKSEAFGKATVDAGSCVGNNLRLPGQYFDQESGLHYNGFRDYDPGTGRFIQSDPIGLRGGINGYAYALNNPLSYADPFGLEVEVGVRKFYPYSVPYARHCFVRFNGNNQDTLSYSNMGITPAPNSGGASYSPTAGKENDSCVRKEMNKCRSEDYDFKQFNCCMCASNALNACGLTKVSPWPNAPRDASDPPYPKPIPTMPPVEAP